MCNGHSFLKNKKKRLLFSCGHVVTALLCSRCEIVSLTISSGLNMPNWTFLTGFSGAVESLVLIDMIGDDHQKGDEYTRFEVKNTTRCTTIVSKVVPIINY